MATWYVRPNTTHSGTRNGQAYETAWGGWSEILWGAGATKVQPTDTLYVCGTHLPATVAAVGNHGAVNEAGRVTIRGDYPDDPGSIVISASGSNFLQIARNYTTIKNVSITAHSSFAVYLFAAADITGVTLDGCTINSAPGQSAISLDGSNTVDHTDFTVTGCTFNGGGGSPGGAAIFWLAADNADPLTTLTRITITNNTFNRIFPARAVIALRMEPGANAGSKMSDIVITGNRFQACTGTALELYGQPYGINTGIRVDDNIVRNQTLSTAFGGGFSIAGFGPSLTDGFGLNTIARNEGYGLHGPTGLINLFYGTCQVYDNYGEEIKTDTIDGAGCLLDHDTRNCVVRGNHFKNLYGKTGISYSGNGITILDSTGAEVYGNITENCYSAIHIGNKLTGQSSNIYNNHFLNCVAFGCDISLSADLTTNIVKNNLFTAASASCVPVRVSTGTWTGESNNCFYGFGATSNHALAGTTKTVDPELNERLAPAAISVLAGGTYLGGSDYYGKLLPSPPPIGAVAPLPARTVTTRAVRARVSVAG